MSQRGSLSGKKEEGKRSRSAGTAGAAHNNTTSVSRQVQREEAGVRAFACSCHP